MQDLRIDIFPDNNHIIHELCKSQREVIEALDLEYPFQVKVGNPRKAQAILDRKSKGKRGRPKGSKGNHKYLPHLETRDKTESPGVDNIVTRKPGRPLGSRNKPKLMEDEKTRADSIATRKPGRPLGSKKRPKT